MKASRAQTPLARSAFFFSWIVLLSVSGLAQDVPPANESPTPDGFPKARETYLGRKIAQTMHYTGAPWLIRESREREEECSTMLRELGIRPGMTICDMGCGNGFYSLQMAEQTGEQGEILAVDIQAEMLRLLQDRAEKADISNIKTIHGTLIDPRLPKDSVDLILCVDVYHEFSHPEQMLRAMRDSLKSNGLLVLVEYREEDPRVPIKPLHKMSKKQILKEMTANGFKLARQFDELPWQHMMFFARDPAFRATNPINPDQP